MREFIRSTGAMMAVIGCANDDAVYCMRAVGRAYPQSHVGADPTLLPERRPFLSQCKAPVRVISVSEITEILMRYEEGLAVISTTVKMGYPVTTDSAGAIARRIKGASRPTSRHAAARTTIGRRI